MATITKRISKDGKVTSYKACIRLKGHPTETSTHARLTDAKRWIASTESAIREGRHFHRSKAAKCTFKEAVDRYLANTTFKGKTRASELNLWLRHIGNVELGTITDSHIIKAKDAILNEVVRGGGKRKSSTVNVYLTHLNHFFSECVSEYKLIEKNPCIGVKKPKTLKGRVRYLSDSERGKLLEVCRNNTNRSLYLIVVLALSTGMRKSELLGIKWQDVDLKSGALILSNTKNGERRRVPVQGLALELLRDHAKVRLINSDLLFSSFNDANRPMSIRRLFDNAIKQAEIENFTFHDLRHSAASYLAMNGAGPLDIAAILGHKTLAMVQRYAHLSDSHLSSTVAAMNAKIFNQ